jgi:hypothetical protein
MAGVSPAVEGQARASRVTALVGSPVVARADRSHG